MCGLCGILYSDRQKQVEPELLRKMTEVIRHRGPDDEGQLIDGSIGLGSRRLSILGLNDGHMPMSTEDGNIWIVYNGELYNHPEIKHNLSSKGHKYRTGSDTESFLHLYREFDIEFLEHTRGMFALALWDRPRQRLILARDRLGIKPLYYHLDSKAIRFASEIKSILCDPEVSREIDYEALNLFLAYLATPAPFTMLKGVKQLFPGEMLIYQEGQVQTRTYWQSSETIIPNDIKNIDSTKHELGDRLREVVQEHLLSDVPVGAFLSGGIDSGILVGLMREFLGPGFKTFSIGFQGHTLFDETQQAQLMARRFETDHHEQILAPNDLLEALDDIIWQLDEPLADSSCLPVYYVSKLASQYGKVVLSGDGGDEIFAGYRKYQAEYYRRFCSWLPSPLLRYVSHSVVPHIPESRANYWMDLLRQVKKFFRGFDPDAFERHLGWAIHFEDALRHPMLNPDIREQINFNQPRDYRRKLYDELPHQEELNRMLWVDLRHGLPADMLMDS